MTGIEIINVQNPYITYGAFDWMLVKVRYIGITDRDMALDPDWGGTDDFEVDIAYDDDPEVIDYWFKYNGKYYGYFPEITFSAQEDPREPIYSITWEISNVRSVVSAWYANVVEMGPLATGYLPYDIIGADGEVIYSGAAAATPGSSVTAVDLNRVLAAKVHPVTPSFRKAYGVWESHKNVLLYSVRYNDSVRDLDSYGICYDWSHDTDRRSYGNGVSQIISDPINGHIGYGMTLPLSMWFDSEESDDSNTLEMRYKLFDGTIVLKTINAPAFAGPATTRIDTAPAVGDITITQNTTPKKNIVFKKGYCGDAFVLYLNRYGGYDSFLFEGNVEETDNFNPKNIRVYMPSNAPKSTDQYPMYANDIAKTFKASTGWLSDDEAHRFAYHLMASPEIYLTYNGIKYSVYIKDKSVSYKRFKNGHRLNQYTVTFEATAKETWR